MSARTLPPRLRHPTESVADYRVAMGWDDPAVEKADKAVRLPGPWAKVAQAMWIADGAPEYSGLGSTWHGHYAHQVQEVFATIYALGYAVTKQRPAKPAKKIRSRSSP